MANTVKAFAEQVFTERWQFHLHFLFINLYY